MANILEFLSVFSDFYYGSLTLSKDKTILLYDENDKHFKLSQLKVLILHFFQLINVMLKVVGK